MSAVQKSGSNLGHPCCQNFKELKVLYPDMKIKNVFWSERGLMQNIYALGSCVVVWLLHIIVLLDIIFKIHYYVGYCLFDSTDLCQQHWKINRQTLVIHREVQINHSVTIKVNIWQQHLELETLGVHSPELHLID